MRITIVLPFPVTKPVGGARIMYEYANRFAAKGHHVVVLHALRRPYKKMKSPLWWKQFIFWLQGAARPNWFPLLPQVSSRIVSAITDAHVPAGEIVFSTWWQMTYAVAKLSPSRGVAINLVQDFENWTGQESLVLASYQLPVHHAAISQWLQKRVQAESGHSVQLIPNAIDARQFFVRQPIAQRKAATVLALYSEEKRKGTVFILEALPQLKTAYPDLQFSFFGVYPRPATLPAWVQYIQKPADLAALYNEHAIFLSASLGEGWALPPAEAMACGCAVICTQIGGHTDYATQGETAELIPVQDPAAIVRAVSKLIDENQYRQQLANAGQKNLLATFNWEHSVERALSWFASLQKE